MSVLDLFDPPDYDTEAELVGRKDADWHLYHLRRIQSEIIELDDHFEDELQRIEARRRDLVGVLDRNYEWHRAALENWHKAQLDENPKAKTIPLAYGTLRSASHRARWDIDDAPFTAWAVGQDNADDLLRTKYTPIAKAVKAAFAIPDGAADDHKPVVAETGEVVPGLTVVPASTSFKADPVR